MITVTIPFSKKKNENVNEAINDLKIQIVNLIRKDPFITRAELVKITKKSDASIYRIIIKLKEKGIIERIGSRKSGHWEIKE